MITTRIILRDALCQLGRGIARACRWRHDGAVIAGGKRGLSPVIALLALLAFVGAVRDAEAAFANGYSYRRLIDITDAQVSSGPHTNFPVLISTTLADLKTTANGGKVTDAEGDDIIFTASDGTTQLAHEVETYVATTGELIAWVRVPSLAATSTLYVYYGNSAVTTFQGNVTSNGVTGVWDTNYMGVWHLKEATNTTRLDSTSNNNDVADATNTAAATGKVGDAADFVPTDYFTLSDAAQTGLDLGTQFTLQAWVKGDEVTTNKVILSRAVSPNSSYKLRFSSDRFTFTTSFDGTAETNLNQSGTSVAGTWYHVVGVYNSPNMNLYINGALNNSLATAGGSVYNGTAPFNISSQGNGTQPFDGIMDEVRVSSTARSAGWILTEYNNQNSPSGFYSMGVEETGPGVATLSSAANQTFTVGQAAAVASTLTVTDGATATITSAQDLRIRIPAALNMTWDTSVTSVTLGGGAAGKVSPTGVTYDDSKTAVLNVTTNFAGSDVLTIAGLKFTSFTAVSSATSLQLVVAGAGGATAATDDKTITIVASATLGASLATSIADSADLSSYSFPSATYSNNVLYIAFTATSCASGQDCGLGVDMVAAVASVSGAGLNFTEIGTPGGVVYSTNGRRIQAWRALVTSGAGTGTVTATMQSGTISASMGAVILAFTGTKTSGTNGSDAVVQWPTNSASGVTSLTVPMAAFADSNNRPVAFISHRGPASTGEPTNHDTAEGYTELWDGQHGSVGMGYMAEWHSTAANTTPSASWTTSGAAGGFALEIAAATVAAATLSSAANQTFTVGQAAATASTLTVTDGPTATITATNDIRIRIPAALNVTWDTSVTSVTLGGGAAGKVSPTGVTYDDSKTAVLNVTTNFAGSDVLTIAGLKFTSFTAVSSATSLQLVVAGAGGATAATDDKTVTIIAATSALLSSAANQTFTVGQASTTASTLTVTDGSPATIKDAQNLRIRIPAALNMTWDPTVTAVSLGGGAAGKVNATLLGYEDGNKTAVLNVTSDFAASDQLTIAGLKFTSFTAVSAASNLELVVAGAAGPTAATDDKTITILAAGALSLSSAANQTFTVGQVSTAAISMTVIDGPAPTITAAQDLRIRIPAGLNMTWDPAVTTVTLGGGAAGKVSATLLAYENGNKTAVLNVTTNFAATDQLTIAGLKFTSFTAVSAASSLQLVVAGAGGATAATDDKTIAIVAVIALSSAANQTFTVGQASTTASTLTATDSSTPAITASQDLRIRIPATLSMTWDPSVTTVTRGGTASGKVSATVTYEDSNKTVRVNVTTDFAASDQLTIAGLKFTSFTAISAHNLQLVVAGSGGATAAIDDKTVTITGGGITNQQTISGCVAPGSGVVTIGTIASQSFGGSSGNTYVNVTGVALSGQNAVVVFVGYNNVGLETVTSVVIDPGGANITIPYLADSNNTQSGGEDARIYLFGLVNPPQGTYTVRVNFTDPLGSSAGINVVVYPLSGVDTSAAFRTPGTAENDGSASSVTVPSAAGDLVLAGVSGETINVSTVASPAVEDRDIGGGSCSGTDCSNNMATAHRDGAATSVNFSWTHDNDHWAAVGVSVKPGSATLTSLTLPSWTPQSGELLLVGVALRNETIVPSVSGNGLTWTLVADRDNDRGQMGVDLYRASGASPTAGSITISLPGNTLPAYAVAVRLSNVDTAVNQGIEAVATASSPDGLDSSVDTRHMKVTVTTVTANAVALAWGGHRGSATLAVPAEEQIILQSSADCGSSGDRMRGHMWQEIVATPGPTELGQDNSLSSAHPWAVIGVSIKPVPPTPPQPPGRFNVFETSTVAGALTGVIRTKIAGNPASLDIIALNSARTAIDTSFTGTVKVEVLDASNNTGAFDGNGCRSSWTVIQTLSNPTFVAGDLGRKTVSFTQANSYKDVRLRVSYPTSSPTQIGCSNDNFAIRPSTLANFAVSDGNDWQTAGTSRALTSTTFATVTHKAGRPMSVRGSAVNATGTTVTTNYTGAPTQWLSACAGAACTSSFGTLTLASTFAAGQLSTDVASYDNVGSFALQLVDSIYASVDAYDTVGDCNANGSYVCSATLNVGRFVPDHFAVALNTPTFGSACGSFTYLGQKFNYATAPVITLTARNFAGGTTTRYEGSWWRITNATLTGKAYTTASGTLDTSGVPGTDPVIAAPGSGTGTLTFSSGTGFFFPRTTPVAPFDAEISLAINVIDADGISYASNPARFGTATAGNGIAFSTGKPMRFGRFAIGNANGSQLVPLLVRVEAQYWSGAPTNAFVTNTLDNCSSIAPANYAMSSYTGNLSGSPTCETAISGGGTLSAGRGTLVLSTPGAGNDGSVILTANLGATASGSTCTTLGGAPVSATAANLPHLQGNWGGGAYDVNPSARASFGVFKGSEEVIFIRENF